MAPSAAVHPRGHRSSSGPCTSEFRPCGRLQHGTGSAARYTTELVSRLREREATCLVSRGYAALLAIDHILSDGAEDGILDVEAVEEPSSFGGRSLTEISYVGADPWIVLLLNESRTRRYLVAVSPDGWILGAMGLPVDEIQRAYFPPRPE
jgi:hypothetical protein